VKKPVSPQSHNASGRQRNLFTSPARPGPRPHGICVNLAYRNYGSYEDELAAMTYYGQRQEALFQATKTASWAEMRLIPGVTNAALFPAREFETAGFASTRTGRPGPGKWNLFAATLGPGKAVRLRLRLAADSCGLHSRSKIFILRVAHIQNRWMNYLRISTAKADFMDGKPLRYRLIANKDFLLYSTGLDCVDNGGQMGSDSNMPRESRRGFFPSGRARYGLARSRGSRMSERAPLIGLFGQS